MLLVPASISPIRGALCSNYIRAGTRLGDPAENSNVPVSTGIPPHRSMQYKLVVVLEACRLSDPLSSDFKNM